MNLNHIQTELVACALCEADGKNPDADVVGGDHAATAKAWQAYVTEARRFIVASQALERWSQVLGQFRSLVPVDEPRGSAPPLN